MNLQNLYHVRRALLASLAAASLMAINADAQTMTVNGSNCAGATVTFGAGSIAINTAGCGGTTTPSPTPTIAGTPPGGNVGIAYSTAFSVTNITSPTLALASGALPPGISISGLTLTGTPTTAGTYSFAVRASGGSASVTSPTYSVTIAAATTPTISGAPAAGTAQQPYSATFTVNNMGSPTLRVASGALPPGVSINGLSLTGTPTTAGTYTFSLTASNGSSSVTSPAYVVVIAPAAGGGSGGGFVSADGALPSPSKRAAAPGPTHTGLMGGGYRTGLEVNAWSMSTASCNATPAITRLWGHKVDFLLDYAMQSIGDDFAFAPNEAVSYEFLADPRAAGVRATISLTTGTTHAPAFTFLSISKSPCDFDIAKAQAGDPCYSSGNSVDRMLSMMVTSGSYGGCKLEPGQTYYMNLRFQNVLVSPAVDACQGTAWGQCGALMKIKY